MNINKTAFVHQAKSPTNKFCSTKDTYNIIASNFFQKPKSITTEYYCCL